MKNQTRPGHKKEALDQAGLFFIAWPMNNLYFEKNLTKPLLRIRDPLAATAPLWGVRRNCAQQRLGAIMPHAAAANIALPQ